MYPSLFVQIHFLLMIYIINIDMLIIIYYIMLFLSKKNILLYSKHGIEFKLYVNGSL